jgi:hypothetical protein
MLSHSEPKSQDGSSEAELDAPFVDPKLLCQSPNSRFTSRLTQASTALDIFDPEYEELNSFSCNAPIGKSTPSFEFSLQATPLCWNPPPAPRTADFKVDINRSLKLLSTSFPLAKEKQKAPVAESQ